MTPLQYERLSRLFSEAAEMPATERDAYLYQAAADDPKVLQEARLLLGRLDRKNALLEIPLVSPDMRACLSDDLAAFEREALSSVGPYRIERVIGEGGFARVYLASQSSPIRRQVAIKVLRAGVDSARILRRFEVEGQTLAELNHPNIVSVIEAANLTDGTDRPYFVMEYVAGLPITDFCRDKKLVLRNRLELMVKLCEAVQHAHVRGVIHRDLKPSNILVAEIDGAPIPKVIDFGVAKILKDAAILNHSAATLHGELIGTLAYMSPEQIQGSADARSDVYALGAVCYQICTGRLPVEVTGRTFVDAVRQIELSEFTPASQHNPEVGAELDAVLSTALASSPEDRYQSAGELAADLRRWLSGDIVFARRRTSAHVVRALVRRHRVGIALAGLVLAALAFATAFATSESARARAAEEHWVARVEQITRAVLNDLAERGGTLALRGNLAENARSDALQLLERRPNDPKILNLAADANRHVSQVYLERSDAAKSLALRMQAFEFRQRASAAIPQDTAVSQALAIDMVVIGDAYFAQGNIEEQRKWFARSLQLTENLANRLGTRESRGELAWSYQRMAAVDLHAGRADSGIEWVSRSLGVTEMLLSEREFDTSALACARQAETYLYSLYSSKSDTVAANEHAEKALRLARKLYQIEPNKREHLAALLHGILSYADSVADENQKSALYEEGESLARGWLAVDPHHEFALGYAINYAFRLAAKAAAANDTDGAKSWVNRAVALVEQVTHRNEFNLWAIASYFAAARGIYMSINDNVNSIRCENRFRQVAKRLVKANGGSPDQIRNCAENLLDIAEASDGPLAMQLAEKALANANPISVGLCQTAARARLANHDAAGAQNRLLMGISIAGPIQLRSELMRQLFEIELHRFAPTACR